MHVVINIYCVCMCLQTHGYNNHVNNHVSDSKRCDCKRFVAYHMRDGLPGDLMPMT